MASKSRQRPDRKRVKPNQLAELGLFDIPDLDAMGADGDSEVDEGSLEDELEALLTGRVPAKPARPKAKAAPVVDIEKMAADCLKDTEDTDDEGNLSTDEDLLNELQSLTIKTDQSRHEETEDVSGGKHSSHSSSTQANNSELLLQERLTMYHEALGVAKGSGDTSKVRRYSRAVKTLESLQKAVKAGTSINEEDIPPVVKVPKSTTTTSQDNLSQSVIDLNKSTLDPSPSKFSSHGIPETKIKPRENSRLSESSTELIARRNQYKIAALQAKRDGNKELALNYLRTVKTFDAVIQALNNNIPVDLSNIPPALTDLPDLTTVTSKGSSQEVAFDTVQKSSDIERAALAAANESEPSEIFAAPPPPTTILEALEQRLEKYEITKQAAEAEGNSGKVRRLQRIIKQYQIAIKDHKAGKTVEFDDLPVPPGFGPIPANVLKSKGNSPEEKDHSGVSKQPNAGNIIKEKLPGSHSTTSTVKNPKIQRANTSTVGEKQLEFLLERQRLFRQAALSAKKNGDIQQAKEYLRMSKGFDSMIEATKCGLPIDAKTIPTPPQLESDFVIVDVAECVEKDNRSQDELFENLNTDLNNQIEICKRNKEHFLRLGDVSTASKFEKLCLESRKDLSVINHLKNKDDPMPRFHYETRLFSMVICNPELRDHDIKVTIERGINLPGKPDDLDSFVKLELPIPPELPQRAKTHTIRDTNNPDFQQEFKFEFNRNSRSQLRQFKRQALKCEVFSKGGFLRSDALLGTAIVKLVDLESKCTIHNSFNLMDGRKVCGGKLEVKIRIRDPLLVKQVEEVREKWLVIGS